MKGKEKIQALEKKIEELETQANLERNETETWIENLEYEHDMKTLKYQQLHDQKLQILVDDYSHLNCQYKNMHRRHAILLDAFQDVKDGTFDEYACLEANRIAESRTKVICEDAKTKVEALQNENKALVEKIQIFEKVHLGLSNTIATKDEEIGKFVAHMGILTSHIEKMSAIIVELQVAENAPGETWKKSIQSLSEYTKELQKVLSQYSKDQNEFEQEKEVKESIVTNDASDQETLTNSQPPKFIENGNLTGIFSFAPLAKLIQNLRDIAEKYYLRFWSKS